VAMIAGNHERWLGGDTHDVPPGNDVVAGGLAFEAEQLPADVRVRITALPPTAVHSGTLFCHASPGSDMLGFSPTTDPADAGLLSGTTHARVVFGHTHIQFRRTTVHDVELVNPGSVGMPFDGDQRAAYLLIAPDGMLELRRVEYDSAASAAALRAIGARWADTVAGWIDDARD
jgi:diadenosine tetraphosphatase ApaH/serine/threonine PP2A family protein phosphatase